MIGTRGLRLRPGGSAYPERFSLASLLEWSQAESVGAVDDEGRPLGDTARAACSKLMRDRLGLSHCAATRALVRWGRAGLPAENADIVACALGVHPSLIWPEWWQSAASTGSEG